MNYDEWIVKQPAWKQLLVVAIKIAIFCLLAWAIGSLANKEYERTGEEPGNYRS